MFLLLLINTGSLCPKMQDARRQDETVDGKWHVHVSIRLSITLLENCVLTTLLLHLISKHIHSSLC